MPIPTRPGQAAIAQFPLTVPGFKGLNTQQQGSILGPEWATKLENSVVDSSGRVAARKGWSSVTTSPHGSAFKSGIEYRMQNGNVQLVLTTATQVLSSTDGSSFTNVTGTAAFTSGNWYLTNFNDFVIGFLEGEKPLIYNGTTSSQVADANAPTGGVGTSAFGRVWCVASDGVTIKYSALLDHTNWTTSDAGSIDMSSIWLDNDRVTGITAFNNLLIVFGQRNIVVWSDGTGSELGIDPTQMQVIDTIPGLGCLNQFTIQQVNGDIWFLANTREVMSFGRVILEQKSGKLTTLSANVSDFLRDTIETTAFNHDNARAIFVPHERFYLLSLPTESAPGEGDEVGKVFVFDTRQFLEDGSARCVGIWNQMVPTVLIYRDSAISHGTLLSARTPVIGELGAYIGGRDDGETYRFIYESGWIDITRQGYLLILKRLKGLFFFDINTNVFMKWAFDFESTFHTRQLIFEVLGGSGEWGGSEWGIGEWGGGVDLLNKRVAGSGTGEYIKVGVEVEVDGGSFAIQQIDLMAKVGRLRG